MSGFDACVLDRNCHRSQPCRRRRQSLQMEGLRIRSRLVKSPRTGWRRPVQHRRCDSWRGRSALRLPDGRYRWTERYVFSLRRRRFQENRPQRDCSPNGAKVKQRGIVRTENLWNRGDRALQDKEWDGSKVCPAEERMGQLARYDSTLYSFRRKGRPESVKRTDESDAWANEPGMKFGNV